MTDLQWRSRRAGAWLVRALEGGSGDPLICLHGSGDSAFAWKPVLGQLCGHSVRAIDLVESQRAPGGPEQRLEADGELLRGVLDSLEAPAHLVGHSYGALLALRFALRHPERLRSLCLTEPIAFGLLRDERGAFRADRRFSSVFAGFFEAWQAGDVPSALARIVDYWNGPGAWAGLAREPRERIALGAERFRAEVLCAYEDRTSVAEVGELALPTLIAYGSETTDQARQVCELLARTVPGARSLRVRGAGHSPMRTHPEIFTTALRELIASADGQCPR